MTSFRNMTSALIALSMVTAPVAAQAQTATASASTSWGGVVMSYISTLCAQQASGCILPLPNAAPPAPAPIPKPVAVPTPPPAPVASGGSFPFLPILLGLGAIAGGVLLLDDDDDDDPISA